MKQKALRLAAALLLAALALTIPAYAAQPAIRSIDTTVELTQDGSAVITQVWDVTVTSGTEYYVPQENLGKIEIRDFSVSDETGLRYQNEGTSWDVDRSIDQKAGRCGMVETARGYELCWGVGSYGDHVFTVQYTMTNLVKAFNDYDGFNHRFVNDQLSSAPQSIRVEISIPGVELDPEETGVWGFGFPGEIYVEDGRVLATSTDSLTKSNYANIMVRLPKGLLDPTNQVNDSFSTLEEEAKEGSDYLPNDIEEGSPNDSYQGGAGHRVLVFRMLRNTIFGLFNFLVGLVPIIVVFVLLTRRKRTAAPSRYTPPSGEALGYYREIPCKGDLPMANYLLKCCGQLSEENSAIGAWLLRWTRAGYVRVEEAEKKTILGTRTEPSILFFPPPAPLPDPCEQKLYDLLMRASGGDNILQEKELYRWAKKHYIEMDSWTESLSQEGERRLRNLGAVATVKEKVFFGLIPVSRTRLTPYGEELVSQLLGFKKYLQDFTIINERKPVEVQLWDDYLVFATLFGIADQVAKDFQALYSKYFQDRVEMDAMDYYVTMSLIRTMSSAGVRGASSGRSAAASSSSGGGGSTSFGGGGGFSGGGSGGGSR